MSLDARRKKRGGRGCPSLFRCAKKKRRISADGTRSGFEEKRTDELFARSITGGRNKHNQDGKFTAYGSPSRKEGSDLLSHRAPSC